MIKSITIANFKNYTSAKAEFVPKLNFFAGLNGAGKTNLLDALHYICVTKGMRTGRDRDNMRFGSDFFRLTAALVHGAEVHEIVVKVSPGKVKDFEIDSVVLEKLADHVGFQPVIVLTPGDQEMIEGASAERRRFADFYLSQTDHDYLNALMHYNKLLQQRNAHLKDKGVYSDKVLLGAFSEKMNPLAQQIMRAREIFVSELNPFFLEFSNELSGSNDPVALKYAPDLEEDLQSAATASISQDTRLGRTTRGVHRDDLEFLLNSRLLRRYGSQGQRKTFLIALHLALHDYLIHHGKVPPIFLLDDIFDKLDDNRILALLKLLGKEDFGQVFISDARYERVLDVCRAIDSNTRLFRISEGEIVQTEDFGADELNDEEEE